MRLHRVLGIVLQGLLLAQSYDLAHKVVSVILKSPLNDYILNVARNTMIKSVETTGMKWEGSYSDLKAAVDWEQTVRNIQKENPALQTPNYYLRPFHAYADGNLCLEAAFEQEIAGKAVGVRHFPSYKARAEEHMRELFDMEIKQMGGLILPKEWPVVVDMGCGTGTSTRRLAKLFPHAEAIIGVDLSPHMVAVGRYLQRSVPAGKLKWIEDIVEDDRVQFLYGNAAQIGRNDSSVDFVHACFLLHELPSSASWDIIAEAHRILKPGGVLCIIEMDPQSPGYSDARRNAFLFSIFKSTEPYLDDYFDTVYPSLPSKLKEFGFTSVLVTAATSRYLAIVARKAGYIDNRPSETVRRAMDQHLKPLQFR